MFYYRSSLDTFVSQDTFQTELSDISEYIVTVSGNEIRLYTCHLKAYQKLIADDENNIGLHKHKGFYFLLFH